jgi:hypothetical protein
MPVEEAVCVACGKNLIEGCQNAVGGGGNIVTGVTEDGEVLVKMCPNMERIRVRQYLESIEPRMVQKDFPYNRSSPLYQPNELDMTQSNMFFRNTDWNVFLSNLKWVAAYKASKNLYFRVVTDLHIVNVFVGNATLRSRLKSQQVEDGELLICNSLPDLVEPPDLLIIRLGVLTYSNKAAADVLAEVLLLRNAVARPTWVVEPAHKAFEPYSRTDFGTSVGMPSCNENVLEYLVENFDQLELEDVEGVAREVIPGVAEVAEAPSLEDMAADLEMGEAAEGLVDPDVSDGEFSDADMDALLGRDSEAEKKKKYKKGGWKK